MSSKNSCHVCQSLCVWVSAHSWSSDTAQQVTCMVKWHMPQICIHFECLSLVSSYVGGSVFFSHPTRSLFFLVFPPLSFKTRVCQTQVCLLDKCPSHQHLSVLHQNLLRALFYIQAYFQVSSLCIAKRTAWKRGCGKVKSPPIPHCQKESVAMLAFFESCWNSTLSTHGS